LEKAARHPTSYWKVIRKPSLQQNAVDRPLPHFSSSLHYPNQAVWSDVEGDRHGVHLEKVQDFLPYSTSPPL
jgi:hypothetical protein